MATLCSYAWYAQRPHIALLIRGLGSPGCAVMSEPWPSPSPGAGPPDGLLAVQRWRAAGDLPKALQPASPFRRKGFDLLWVEKVPMLAIMVAVGLGTVYSQDVAGGAE